jgi:hypothetical protein
MSQKLMKIADKIVRGTLDHPTLGSINMMGKKTVRIDNHGIVYDFEQGNPFIILPNKSTIEVFSDCITHNGKKYPCSMRALQLLIVSSL